MSNLPKPDKTTDVDPYIGELEFELRETSRGLMALTLELEQAQERYRNIFDLSLDGILITDLQTQIIEVNEAFEAITGFSAFEVVGEEISCFMPGWQTGPAFKTLFSDLKNTGFWQGEIAATHKDGSPLIQRLTISPIVDDKGNPSQYLGIIADITAQKRAEKQVNQLAYFDHLTDLPNRTLFGDRLEQAIRQAHRNSSKLAVLFLDLDNFKFINDSLGHIVGDKFLVEVARSLQSAIRECDTVGRFGGDEFIIILNELQDAEAAGAVAHKIIKLLANPFVVDGKDVFTGGSIGISVYPDDSMDGTTLVKHADTAMYFAKSQGKNACRFFTKQMNARVKNRMEVEADLRHALKGDDFYLLYQPRQDTASLDIVGAEALIRWQHPKKGLISPLDFIPLAEEIGQIQAIFEWVIKTSFRQMRLWANAGLAPPKLSINVSARQLLSRTFGDEILDAAKLARIDPSWIEIEITEGALMINPEDAIERLSRLKDQGITIAIDDFGTGYSSLSYLTRLPLDVLKIDRSFINALDEGEEGCAVANTIIALARNIGLKVVAEGVENESQLKFLRERGCDQIQGFLHYPPLSVVDYTRVLSDIPSKKS